MNDQSINWCFRPGKKSIRGAKSKQLHGSWQLRKQPGRQQPKQLLRRLQQREQLLRSKPKRSGLLQSRSESWLHRWQQKSWLQNSAPLLKLKQLLQLLLKLRLTGKQVGLTLLCGWLIGTPIS